MEITWLIYKTIHPVINEINLKQKVLSSGDNDVITAPTGHTIKVKKLNIHNPTSSEATIYFKDVITKADGSTEVITVGGKWKIGPGLSNFIFALKITKSMFKAAINNAN